MRSRDALMSIDQPLLQRIASVEAQPALAVVGVGPHDVEAVADSVLQYSVGLVLGRVELVLGRHAHICGAGTGSRTAVPMLTELVAKRLTKLISPATSLSLRQQKSCHCIVNSSCLQ